MIDKKTSISDLPFSEVHNDFGTDRYVNGLIKFIENSSTPITIALQGEWGSGKTSMMTRLKRELCDSKDSKFVGIEINTWEHSMLSTPEMAVMNILESLIKSISGGDPEPEKKYKKYLKFGYKFGREAIKVATGKLGSVIIEGLLRDDLGKLGKTENEDEKVTLHELRES
ncbi:MAG: KAP family NTPase, partial [Muribaculaceae bacterium]|nr:KAP family NTPase [Muribaculaceae bacterium]